MRFKKLHKTQWSLNRIELMRYFVCLLYLLSLASGVNAAKTEKIKNKVGFLKTIGYLY